MRTTATSASPPGRVLVEHEAAAVRRGVPDPGIRLPQVAVPTVLIWLGSLLLWVAATTVVLSDTSRWWLLTTIPVHAFVTFAMFTVLHESTHHAAGRLGWVNQWLGRLSMPFVAAWSTYPLFKYLHIEHHRNTNDTSSDPDAWTEAGPTWQLPLRWLVMDLWYVVFYLPRIARRPRNEIIGVAANTAVVVAVAATLIGTGYGWELVLIYLIPQRLGVGILAWWFDWLPHHDLGVTAKVDRFRATRVRVGWERLLNPVMFYQNYHLVHHIHPTIPFYRYVRAWQNTQGDYLDRDVPISTAWGSELTPAEYRAWRDITEDYEDTDNAAPGKTGPGGRLRFHPLRVSEVRALTTQAVSITFDVPAALRDTFRFRPGQNVVVRTSIDGHEVRRNYSICTAAGSGVLRIGVKHVGGGRFSTYANTTLRTGDILDVMAPSGQFTLTEAPARPRHLAAVAAGSGITPVISILATALGAEPDASATLLYANHNGETAMFGPELSMLAAQFDGRLQVLHFYSRPSAPGSEDTGVLHPDSTRQVHTVFPHRLDAARLTALLTESVHRGRSLADVDEWYLCGPKDLTDAVTGVLTDNHHASAERIHHEQFVPTRPTEFAADAGVRAATVHITLDGTTTELTAHGDESLLEAALGDGLDAPYSCTGGACATCRATLLQGTVHMEQNYTLSDDDIAGGAILTCQSRPTSDRIHLSYDHHTETSRR